MCLYYLQIYIGPSRTTVHKNQNILQDLAVGAMIAAKGDNFPRVGRVTEIPSNPNYQSEVEVDWYRQERAPHKPRWLRYFQSTNVIGKLPIEDIILYDFQLTNNGAFKKKTRDYLKTNST